jgi:hypothetical protein
VTRYLVWNEDHDEPDGLAIEADSLREAARDVEVEACPELHVSERKLAPDRKAAR